MEWFLKCDEKRLTDYIERLSVHPDVDAVVVAPHWGTEDRTSPSITQKNLARKYFESGALAVIGSHPHVLQPWEKMTVTDKSGQSKERFVIYSLGNYFSNQMRDLIGGDGEPIFSDQNDTSIVLYLNFLKTPDGDVNISEVAYTPIEMTRKKHAVSPGKHSYEVKLVDTKKDSKTLKNIYDFYSPKNVVTLKGLESPGQRCFIEEGEYPALTKMSHQEQQSFLTQQVPVPRFTTPEATAPTNTVPPQTRAVPIPNTPPPTNNKRRFRLPFFRKKDNR
jgi:hypothetical protein